MKPTHNELKVEKFIVFTITNYHFAVPISEVLQIVSRPATTAELSKAGLVQIGRWMIRLLDLHQQLQLEDLHQLENQPFLVITQSLPGEFWAIPVSEPPNLIEFPLELIQLLPQSGTQSGVLRAASYAATIPMNGITVTVFLLDIKRMLSPTAMLPPAVYE